MTFRKIQTFLTTALILGLVSGCTPFGAAVGVGATLGVSAASEGGVTAAAKDATIRIEISNLWFQKSVDMYRFLGMTVTEGRVLLTGTVPNPDMRVDAVRIAWQVEGVKQVINEIQVAGSEGFTGFLKDSWITSTVRSKLTFDKYISSINYSVETVNGVVYLMGIAYDQPELDRALEHARNTQGVQSVVSYVRLRGEKPAGVGEPTDNSTLQQQAPANNNYNSMAPDDSAGVSAEPVPLTRGEVEAEPLR